MKGLFVGTDVGAFAFGRTFAGTRRLHRLQRRGWPRPLGIMTLLDTPENLGALAVTTQTGSFGAPRGIFPAGRTCGTIV